MNIPEASQQQMQKASQLANTIGGQFEKDPELFNTIAEQAKSNPEQAMAQFIATMINKIKQGGEQDLSIIFMAVFSVAIELIEVLNQQGIADIKPEQTINIVNQAIKMAIKDNPELGEEALTDPNMQQQLQQEQPDNLLGA